MEGVVLILLSSDLTRKEFLLFLSALGVSVACDSGFAKKISSNSLVLKKKIASSGEWIPVIGMGTWITFNVSESKALMDQRVEVLREFFAWGGGMIDSSPMYGSSEEVLGYALEKLGHPKNLFAATKVWTNSKIDGLRQISESKKLWKLKKFELFQVHNLLQWEKHLETLFDLKQKGDIKYVGVTTSHGRKHSELEKILQSQSIDFVQLTYNVEDRGVEQRLLPLAKEKNIAVIANRPFQGGYLIDRLQSKPLPKFAQDIDCASWPVFLLKFIVSHPSITCTIPATSKLLHMKENMSAGTGPLPSEKMRVKMLNYVRSIL